MDSLRILPRLLFTLFAILSDWHFFRICKKVYANSYVPANSRTTETNRKSIIAAERTEKSTPSIMPSPAQCGFILHICSWSLSYCLSRTLGNTLETGLLIIGTSLLLCGESNCCSNVLSNSSHITTHNCNKTKYTVRGIFRSEASNSFLLWLG